MASSSCHVVCAPMRCRLEHIVRPHSETFQHPRQPTHRPPGLRAPSGRMRPRKARALVAKQFPMLTRQPEATAICCLPSGEGLLYPQRAHSRRRSEAWSFRQDERQAQPRGAQAPAAIERLRVTLSCGLTPELSRPAKRVRLGRTVMRAKVNPKPAARNGAGRVGSTGKASEGTEQIEASKDRSRQRRQSEGHETILVLSGANAVHPKPSEAKPEGESEPNRSVTDQRRRQRRNVSR